MLKRHLQGLSVSEVARRLGVDQSTASGWFSGRRRVPAERVLDIERVTGISRHVLRPDLYPRQAA